MWKGFSENSNILGKTSISKKSFSYSYIIFENQDLTGQVRKSVGRMSWHQEPTKDVTSCDKPGLGANIHRPRDFRMGKPDKAIPYHHILNT